MPRAQRRLGFLLSPPWVLLRWDVNHLFILNVDPRCRVTPEFFFARAATLTTIWILIFGCLAISSLNASLTETE